MSIKIGCCGFPVKRAVYAAHLPVVEVQQTFYDPPREATARRWRAELPAPFEFTLKAWQLITHEASSPTYRRLKTPLTPEERQQAGSFKPTFVVQRAWEKTREWAAALEARVILFQCPASFGATAGNIDNLRRFFGELKRDPFLLAWEPRAWPQELVAQLCRELDLIPVVDPLVSPPLPSPLAYFRLHGRTGFRYSYTGDDLRELKEILRNYQEGYVFFNNVSMWADARRFIALLENDKRIKNRQQGRIRGEA